MNAKTINHIHDAFLEAQVLFEVIQTCASNKQELPISTGLG